MTGFGNDEQKNLAREKAAREGLIAAGWTEDSQGVWSKNRQQGQEMGGHPEYRKVLSERLSLHIEKSGGYGNSTDPFANFSAVATVKGQPRFVYPVDRSLEKITRIYSLIAQERYSELEEEFKDVASLMDCATAMLRSDGTGT